MPSLVGSEMCIRDSNCTQCADNFALQDNFCIANCLAASQSLDNYCIRCIQGYSTNIESGVCEEIASASEIIENCCVHNTTSHMCLQCCEEYALLTVEGVVQCIYKVDNLSLIHI
eukprot:TRINITY_DN2177_c0_g1_i4.p3 TRINITY_DN2177_c0_g1~~TRINITY_DN2177_c0_g1_i4.p3  ORF type:complete len:115 (+),score=18.33 TRINITY_DN2177_c0_g1_i4:92-436(+)